MNPAPPVISTFNLPPTNFHPKPADTHYRNEVGELSIDRLNDLASPRAADRIA
jgi:hypothetical protein